MADPNTSRYICIYPAYMNSKKTLAQGRRIPKTKAVENPTFAEILEALQPSGLQTYGENKLYCRERSTEFNARGRVRVCIKNEDGSLLDPAFPTRESVMLYITSNIPKVRAKAKSVESSQNVSKKKNKGKK